MFSAPAVGKIYVWKDEAGRVHYANDEENVPPEILEDDKKFRIIETTIKSAAPQDSAQDKAIRTVTVQPPAAPTPATTSSSPAPGKSAEMQGLQTDYRKVLDQMRDYRKSNQDLNTSAYRDLQNRLRELRKSMSDARPRPKRN